MGMMNRGVYKNHKPGTKVKPVLVTGPGRTKQEFREETDINVIVARFQKDGRTPRMTELQPVFADVSEIGSYADIIRRVSSADEAFMSLPPNIRNRFNNDSVKLIEFLQDEKNRPEAIQLGLVPEPKKAPEAPAAQSPAPVVPPGQK